MTSNLDTLNDKKCNPQTEWDLDLGISPILFKCMKQYGSRIFQHIADTGETDTYEQFLNRSVRTALHLREKGIGKNDIVCICTHNQKNSNVPVLATFFVGAISANFDPKLSYLDTKHLLKLVQPKVIFVSTESLPFMQKCLNESNVKSELVVFGVSEKYSQFSEYLEPHQEETTFQPSPVSDSKETAMIMFSSGTTGLPKGICLSHYSVIGDLFNFLKNMPNSTGLTVNLWYTTVYWISAVKMWLMTILKGDAAVVCSKFDPRETWQIIQKYKVSAMFLAPHLGYEFLQHRPNDVYINNLRLLFIAGSYVTKQLMESLRAALPNTIVTNMYAQTEPATTVCRFNVIDPIEVEMQIRKPLSCGKIVPNILWKVVDPDSGKTLGPNQRGEIRIKCDTMMNGYYNMDSSEAYDSEGYFKTGDIVYYDEEGCFYVVDRIREMFKYKSWHIVPAVLEHVLLSHPAVKEAVVIGKPHEIDGEEPMGVVVLHDEHKNVTPEQIEAFVEERVPDIQRLRGGVKIVKELLRTVTGKLKRNDMKKMVFNDLI